MTSQKNCPHCHQPMPITRLGVRMSPLKARIFDAIKRAGVTGITRRDLLSMLGLDMLPSTLQVHVSQINGDIDDTGYRIVGRGGYRLTRVGKGNGPAVNGAASLMIQSRY